MTDTTDAIRHAWQCIADANVEHDQAHEQRACAELHRLEQLIPEPRSGDALVE